MEWLLSQTKCHGCRPDSLQHVGAGLYLRNGKYYFYFPTSPKDSTYGRGFAIGVAIADKPEGPYVPAANTYKRSTWN